MSGGYFNYQQHNIQDIINELEHVIQSNCTFQNQDDPQEEFTIYKNYEYSPAVIKKFREGLTILKIAYIYTQRIDYLLEGDDNEESFLRRLQEDINNLNREHEFQKHNPF